MRCLDVAGITGTCVHADVCDSSSPHDDSHTHDGVEEHTESLINGFVAVWFGCDHPTQSPSDHTHSCDEGSCTFVMARPVQHLDFAAVMSLVAIEQLRLVSNVGASHFNRAAIEPRSAFTLVGHRCALQQSWQI